MPELAEVQKVNTVGAMDKGYTSKNQARIQKEEEELQKLLSPDPKEEVQETSKEEGEEEEVSEEKLSAEEKSFKKRYGDLRRHMQKKEKEWEDRFEELKKGSKSLTPPTSEADVEKWVKDHPQVASIVRALAKKEAEERIRDTEAHLLDIREAEEQAQRLRAEAAIQKAHPDFNDLKNSDEFHVWAEEQPKWVQDALYENADDARSVIRVIDLYKVDKGIDTKSQKRRERDAATEVKTGSRVRVEEDETSNYWTESRVHKLSDKDYEKHEPEILEAMRTGKFKYDISGGAR